jgi:hypothetical protein
LISETSAAAKKPAALAIIFRLLGWHIGSLCMIFTVPKTMESISPEYHVQNNKPLEAKTK